MKYISFLILFMLSIQFSDAQYQVEAGARQGAMCGSGLILSDIWSSYHNQAGLADISGISAGLFYTSIFNMPDLRETAFAVALPTEKFGSAGLNYTYSGNSFSNFSKFGLAYSKRLGKRITAGVQIDYLRFVQLNYGNDGAAVGEFGLIAEPVDNFFIAAHVFNPWRANYTLIDETLESILRVGAAYYFSEKVVFMLETEKELDQKAIFRAGTEYNIMHGLFIRAGVATNPNKFSFGLGYNYKGVSIDASYISHQTIGYYMQFGLGYTLNKKNDKMIE